MITSFKLARLQTVKEYAPRIRVGYLAKEIDEKLISALTAIGADEICPHASLVTADAVRKWHRIGFNVRAWGVANEERMQAVYEAGADGMTFNAPDVSYAYIEKTKTE